MEQRKRGPRLTPEKRRQIRQLAEEGASERRLIEELGVSKGSIWWTLHGMARPGARAPEWQPRAGRLDLEQRVEIAVGLGRGENFTTIATRLGVHVSTVSREVGGAAQRSRYRPAMAHRRARQRTRRPKHRRLELNPRLRRHVVVDLRAWWSPQQIAARLRTEYPDDPEMWVSHETIYKTLYVQGKGSLRREVAACLRSGRVQRRARGGTRGHAPITDGVPISARPAEASDRAVPGHWEGDLIFGRQSDPPIGTLVERSTRYVLLFQPEDKTAGAVRRAMTAAIQTLPTQLFKTLTWDRGSEMAAHRRFTVDTGVEVFFCDPHSPWQRGTNENTNGLLRQYFPKGSDFSILTQAKLDAASASLNNRPRQTLNWLKPAEALAQLLALTD